MTIETTANGPGAEAGAAQAAAAASPDNRATETATALNGSQSGGTDWLAGLSEDNRSLVEAKKWDRPDAVLKSYRDLESHASKALVKPGDDAKPEDWNAFYAKLGRPEKADGYEFTLPDGVPETMPYDETLKTNFQTWAHEAGLNPQQANVLHAKYVSQMGEQYAGAVAETKSRVEGAHAQLIKDWGNPGSEKYDRSVQLADRAIRHLGGEDLRKAMKEHGVLTDAGEVANATFAKMLADVGAKLYSEDSVYGGSPTAGPNPFSDGEHFNLTKQGEILRSDPARAKALITAAGKKPADFRL